MLAKSVKLIEGEEREILGGKVSERRNAPNCCSSALVFLEKVRCSVLNTAVKNGARLLQSS